MLQKVKPGAKLPKAVLKQSKVNPPKTEPEDESEEGEPESDVPKSESEGKSEREPEDEPKGDELKNNDGEPDKFEDDEHVELIFEDEDGEPVDEVKNILNTEDTSQAERDLKVIHAKIKHANESEEDEVPDDEEYTTRDNALPPNLEEGEVVLGIMYVLISIGLFFKKIADYEDEVIGCYEQLDENEVESRKEKLSTIKIMCNKFISHSEERITKLSDEEQNLKLQLVRLTVILIQADALKTRVEQNPEKYGELLDKSDQVYNPTRNTIHELNLETLKLRDTADELLSNYQSSIEELMEI